MHKEIVLRTEINLILLVVAGKTGTRNIFSSNIIASDLLFPSHEVVKGLQPVVKGNKLKKETLLFFMTE